MRKSGFDVPEAMQFAYRTLESMHFVPRLPVAPNEWHHQGIVAGSGILEFRHVGGEVEATWKPRGKKSRLAEIEIMRWKHPGSAADFRVWLIKVLCYVAEETDEECPVATALLSTS